MFLVDACESFDIFAEKQEDGKYIGKEPGLTLQKNKVD